MQTPNKLKNLTIKLFILDVDGVLTDGKIYLADNGIETKCFNVRDGLGLKMLLNNSIEVAVISGRKSKATKKRLLELGIKHLYFGASDKIPPFNRIKNQLKLNNAEIAYIGDDLPDLPVMQQVGFKIAVADATPKLLELADYITKNKGGDGAVREACELILNALG